MLGKIASCSIALVLGASTLFAADADHPSATFKVSQTTGIPGRTLAPGTYSIHVVDHLSDRYILRVEGPSTSKTLFIGIANKNVPDSTHGVIKWSTEANSTSYLRGWNFPTLSTPLEFAYPKADAVAVAKANNAQVPAIDPESEGMVAKTGLSSDEMHIITLWLLSPTHVGPNDAAGIKAERFQQVASISHKPAIARLPHTASMLPWVWLTGLMSLIGALTLRATRFAPARSR